jgi:hypothetical protein
MRCTTLKLRYAIDDKRVFLFATNANELHKPAANRVEACGDRIQWAVHQRTSAF